MVLRKNINTMYIINISQRYLKAGAGKACAGHKIVILLISMASKARLLSVEVNLGETRPTGSMNKLSHLIIKLTTIYLKSGTGNA